MHASSLECGEPGGLPSYDENAEADILSDIENFREANKDLNLPIVRSPSSIERHQQNGDAWREISIVNAFFQAVTSKKDEAVALMIEKQLVTPNTTDSTGRTPLLAAVSAQDIRMVQELVDFGADIDAFGKYNGIERTPLQLAASLGNLPLVKLFVDAYHANDAIVAPDGQLALRLASDNGHRDVMEFLPARRGGGWRRWKTHHAIAIQRAERAIHSIYRFCRFFVWSLPKFFLWTVPKECAKELRESADWCWKNRHKFGPWWKKQLAEIPSRIKKTAKWTMDKAKKIPKAGKDFTKGLIKYLRELLTERIPKAIAIVAKWVWRMLGKASSAIASVAMRFVSLLHTMVTAIATFFRTVTLSDIANGIKWLLRAIFVSAPKRIWEGIRGLGNAIYDFMETLLGLVGEIIWYLGAGLVWLVSYIPKKLWIVLTSLASSLGKAGHEIKVWMNPKA